jgi:hypothetical protein
MARDGKTPDPEAALGKKAKPRASKAKKTVSVTRDRSRKSNARRRG